MTVWVLEQELDGHYSPVAYFSLEEAAHKVMELTARHMPEACKKYRVSRRTVWDASNDYIANSEGHHAKILRIRSDPEWAEYQRLKEKFK